MPPRPWAPGTSPSALSRPSPPHCLPLKDPSPHWALPLCLGSLCSFVKVRVSPPPGSPPRVPVGADNHSPGCRKNRRAQLSGPGRSPRLAVGHAATGELPCSGRQRRRCQTGRGHKWTGTSVPSLCGPPSAFPKGAGGQALPREATGDLACRRSVGFTRAPAMHGRFWRIRRRPSLRLTGPGKDLLVDLVWKICDIAPSKGPHVPCLPPQPVPSPLEPRGATLPLCSASPAPAPEPGGDPRLQHQLGLAAPARVPLGWGSPSRPESSVSPWAASLEAPGRQLPQTEPSSTEDPAPSLTPRTLL